MSDFETREITPTSGAEIQGLDLGKALCVRH